MKSKTEKSNLTQKNCKLVELKNLTLAELEWEIKKKFTDKALLLHNSKLMSNFKPYESKK